MTTNPFLIVAAAAAVSAAAVGGLYYGFSSFVMRGLDRTGPVDAITAMRGINAEAERNAPLLVLVFGSALLALAAGIIAVVQWRQQGSGYVVAGAVFALVATVVTVACNVPLNNHLAGIEVGGLSAADALREWQAYLGTVDGMEPRPRGGATDRCRVPAGGRAVPLTDRVSGRSTDGDVCARPLPVPDPQQIRDTGQVHPRPTVRPSGGALVPIDQLPVLFGDELGRVRT